MTWGDGVAECRVCGADIEHDGAVCDVCGRAATGATASFEPVGASSAAAGDAVTPSASAPCLIVRKGPTPGEQFFLDTPTITVGRDPECDIFLNDMTVSRTHAVLTIVDGVVTVRDAGSLNGTYVNGVCVDSAELCSGDLLQIGTFQMSFLSGTGGAR